MAKAKKKTLPKDFRELLEKGDVAQLKAVFDTCEVDARVSYGDKETALAFFACPPELARWLVAQGADIAAVDIHGEFPCVGGRRKRGRCPVDAAPAEQIQQARK